MRRWVLAASAALALVTGGQAWAAKPLPEGGVTLEEFRDWLRDAGYKAQIEKSKDGTRYIDSAADGLQISIYFYDCKQNRCQAAEYYVGFKKGEDTPSLEKVNAFNRDKRYLKAYIAEDGGAAFEWDVNLTPGGTWESVDDDFNTFVNYLPEAKKLVNW